MNLSVSSGGAFNSMKRPQQYRTGPGHDLAGLHYILQNFCARHEDKGGGGPGELATR